MCRAYSRTRAEPFSWSATHARGPTSTTRSSLRGTGWWSLRLRRGMLFWERQITYRYSPSHIFSPTKPKLLVFWGFLLCLSFCIILITPFLPKLIILAGGRESCRVYKEVFIQCWEANFNSKLPRGAQRHCRLCWWLCLPHSGFNWYVEFSPLLPSPSFHSIQCIH